MWQIGKVFIIANSYKRGFGGNCQSQLPLANYSAAFTLMAYGEES
jgi:hypothetical protein